jgi:hypothetical protein
MLEVIEAGTRAGSQVKRNPKRGIVGVDFIDCSSFLERRNSDASSDLTENISLLSYIPTYWHI